MSNKIVEFTATSHEHRLMYDIVDRGSNLGLIYDRLDMLMDLDACHSNGCPLDFMKLLEFGDSSFIHDVIGIAENINRNTGKLMNHFLPRCHKRGN